MFMECFPFSSFDISRAFEHELYLHRHYGGGRGACSKGHRPRTSPAQCYPPNRGGVRDAFTDYRTFIAGGVSEYTECIANDGKKKTYSLRQRIRHSQVGPGNS